jgi:bifunctional DNase/RNase
MEHGPFSAIPPMDEADLGNPRMAVPMELSRIFIREMTDMQIIELTEIGGSRSFPIVIGLPEAFAIERRLKGQAIPRPQTHDLCASIIRELGGELTSIRINDLSGGTFFARLVVRTAGGEIEIDSRPSDAIALGVAEGVPILVEESVLEAANRPAEFPPPSFDDSELAEEDDDEEDEGDQDDADRDAENRPGGLDWD